MKLPNGSTDANMEEAQPKTEADSSSPESPREDEISPIPHIPAPPDGGFTAWLHVGLAHMVFFNTWGIANSFGVFQQYYTETLTGVSPSSIGWIGGTQMFLLFFGGVVSGRATDAGYFRHCFCFGVAMQVFGMLMASLAKEYYQILLSQGICVGLGSGFVFTPALSVMSSYFKTKRSLAVGIAAAGSSTGGMVYPAMVNSLLRHSSVGYGWTMRIFAFIMLATQVPSLIAYRPYLPKRAAGPFVDWSAFRQKSWVFFAVGMFLNFWGLYLAFFYLGIYTRETFHLESSANLLIVLNGVSAIGRIVPNVLGERYTGILNMTILVSLVCALLIYCWAAIRSVTGLYVWAVAYGIFAGGIQALFPALATQQAPEPDKVGTWTGMTLTMVSFAGLTLGPIDGAIIKANGGSYLGAQIFSGTSMILGAILLTLSRCSRVGTSWRAKV